MRGEMATTIELEAEPLTAEAFAPYGQLIAARDDAADYAQPLLEVWHLDFRADAPVRLQIMRYHEKPMTFSRLERHTRVSEGRIPLDGARAVLAVAGVSRGWSVHWSLHSCRLTARRARSGWFKFIRIYRPVCLYVKYFLPITPPPVTKSLAAVGLSCYTDLFVFSKTRGLRPCHRAAAIIWSTPR